MMKEIQKWLQMDRLPANPKPESARSTPARIEAATRPAQLDMMHEEDGQPRQAKEAAYTSLPMAEDVEAAPARRCEAIRSSTKLRRAAVLLVALVAVIGLASVALSGPQDGRGPRQGGEDRDFEGDMDQNGDMQQAQNGQNHGFKMNNKMFMMRRSDGEDGDNQQQKQRDQDFDGVQNWDDSEVEEPVQRTKEGRIDLGNVLKGDFDGQDDDFEDRQQQRDQDFGDFEGRPQQHRGQDFGDFEGRPQQHRGQDFGDFEGRPQQQRGQDFGDFEGRPQQQQQRGQGFGDFEGRPQQQQQRGQGFGGFFGRFFGESQPEQDQEGPGGKRPPPPGPHGPPPPGPHGPPPPGPHGPPPPGPHGPPPPGPHGPPPPGPHGPPPPGPHGPPPPGPHGPFHHPGCYPPPPPPPHHKPHNHTHPNGTKSELIVKECSEDFEKLCGNPGSNLTSVVDFEECVSKHFYALSHKCHKAMFMTKFGMPFHYPPSLLNHTLVHAAFKSCKKDAVELCPKQVKHLEPFNMCQLYGVGLCLKTANASDVSDECKSAIGNFTDFTVPSDYDRETFMLPRGPKPSGDFRDEPQGPEMEDKFDADFFQGKRNQEQDFRGERNQEDNFRGGFRGERNQEDNFRGGFRGERNQEDNFRGGFRGERDQEDNFRGGFRGERNHEDDFRGGFRGERNQEMNQYRGDFRGERNQQMNQYRGDFRDERNQQMNQYRGDFRGERNQQMNQYRGEHDQEDQDFKRFYGHGHFHGRFHGHQHSDNMMMRSSDRQFYQRGEQNMMSSYGGHYQGEEQDQERFGGYRQSGRFGGYRGGFNGRESYGEDEMEYQEHDFASMVFHGLVHLVFMFFIFKLVHKCCVTCANSPAYKNVAARIDGELNRKVNTTEVTGLSTEAENAKLASV